jgi:hypothetical protein|eukprot:SAG25_NODE_860_length_5031_cov_10.214517_3_plen_281_part_00
MIHICDFWATFVSLAGGDPTDSGGPSPLDSIDQSAYLLGTTAASARTLMVHDHYLHGSAAQVSGAEVEATTNVNRAMRDALLRPPPTTRMRSGKKSVTVTFQTKYTGGGCHEHFGGHFWLKTADLASIGLPAKPDGGALIINGRGVNIQHFGSDASGSGCDGCCSGCPLTIFQIQPFSISSLNLHPGANATVSYSATPVPAPPPPPPPLAATGAMRVGDFKLLVGPQRMASWFGDFSPNATFNSSATATTACAARPCLFNISAGMSSFPSDFNDLSSGMA